MRFGLQSPPLVGDLGGGVGHQIFYLHTSIQQRRKFMFLNHIWKLLLPLLRVNQATIGNGAVTRFLRLGNALILQ
jgi:hypothetical protein